MGITVDIDNLEELGDELHGLAGFLDGGQEVGTGGYTTPDLAERTENVKEHLAGVWRVPSLLSNDHSMSGSSPEPAVQNFATNWGEVRALLASDIREVGSMLQTAGRGYQYEDEDLAFQVDTTITPAATPVVGTPTFTG
jgi:hypothetical protein